MLGFVIRAARVWYSAVVREVPKNRRIRVAIVGAGAMGRRHARVFASLDAFSLSHVFDVREEAARDVTLQFGGSIARELNIAIEGADAVVIATPIATHAGAALAAIRAGRHVLVEKPVCARVTDADALVDAAGNAGVVLAVGHSERFNPVIRAIVEVTEPEEIQAIACRRAGPSIGREHVLLNLGIHDLDLAGYLTRSAAELVHASGSRDEASARVRVRTASGATADVDVDRHAHVRVRTIRVTTRDTVLEGDLLAPSLVRRSGDLLEAIALDRDEPLAAQARAFAAAIQGDAEAEIANGADGASALVIANDAAAEIAAFHRGSLSKSDAAAPLGATLLRA